MKRLLLLCCFLPTLALAQRVVVVQGATFGGVDWKELPGVTALAVRAVPVDAAALAAQADVLVCKPDALTPAQQAAIEGFVRGGGGLFLDGGGNRTAWRGGVLDAISPAIATYDAHVALAAPRAGEGAPAGLDLTAFPRIGSATNAATPDRAPVSYLNLLSAWYFDKPLWQRDAQTWLVADDPAATPLLSTARYGAGRVAIANWFALADGHAPALLHALAYVLHWLGGGPWQAPGTLSVAVRGYALPDWYAAPLDKGLHGMGDKLTAADFVRPPEALWEAGFTLTDTTAPALALFGTEADVAAPADVVVLRAPAGVPTPQAEFDAARLVVVTPIKRVEVDGATVALPHRAPAFDLPLPTLDVPDGKPAVTLPDTWRMAFTNDTDTDRDLTEGWQAPGFDDHAWPEGKIGAQRTTVFGETLGYDGAIWYRGSIDVAPEAAIAAAALHLEARDTRGTVTVFVDGKQLALEPHTAQVSLATVGAGRHLLAVRVYGELRTNTGLTALDARYLPLLWKADPAGIGWAQGWYKPETPTTDWQPVSDNFHEEPAGMGPTEGWARLTLNAPAAVAPFTALLTLNLNVEAVVFVNGVRVGANAPDRQTLYRLPMRLFKPGKNVIAVWARYSDRQGRTFSLRIVPTQPLVYRAVVSADRDGRSLRAVLQYDKTDWAHHVADASITVNGRAVGGNVAASNTTVELLAPYALHAGDNTVEVRLSRAADGPAGLARLEVVDLPATMTVPLAGWARCPLATAGLWTDTLLDDRAWEPVPGTWVNDYQRDWIISAVPDLNAAGMAYRAHLTLGPDDLKRIHTLYLRHAAVGTLYVNGTPVTPDDEWYYSLNAALRAGDNVLAFTPEPGQCRAMNLPTPANREGRAQLPVLRADRAPLLPADARLGAFRLNRTFPVGAAPRDGQALFTWPNGAPAVTTQGHEISAAPGLLCDLFPAPNLGVFAHHTGGANTQEYELVERLNRDGFGGDRTDQLLPALLHAGFALPVITAVRTDAAAIYLTVSSPTRFSGEISWHLLDWEGARLGAGETPVAVEAGKTAVVAVPLPDLSAVTAEGAALGRYVRLRAALLTADRRATLAFLDRHLAPAPPVSLTLAGDTKQEGHNTLTATLARRVLHASDGQLVERFVYLPGETVAFTATAANRLPAAQQAVVRVIATPGLGGAPVLTTKTLTLAPCAVVTVPFILDAKQTGREQPWTILAEVTVGGAVVARQHAGVVIAQPRGVLADVSTVTDDNRNSGGYMWQMTPHAYVLEHRGGTDAQPVPEGGAWWTKVRQAGDGNWLVAEGIHRGGGGGDQDGLPWGPFYDQTRGEIMDSFGWFPNGENIRAWWSPAAMREPARTVGNRPVVMQMSDWWQYDAGFPWDSYATLQMFNAFLVANKGQTIAGKTLDGAPIIAPTLRAMHEIINRDYKAVYGYFNAAGLARSAAYTGMQLTAAAPGSTQSGQGAYASTLPATVGGITLGPQWAAAESEGILDADNHPFAGDWQYGVESTTFRAIGIDNHLLTHWETPMNYHGDRDFTWTNSPLPAARWRRRLLDSRWLAIADQTGAFQRVLNTSHNEDFMAGILPHPTRGDIGGGVLPYQWWIKDRLAALSMTISPAQPLSPLLLVGESRMDWTQYYGILGKLRNAGLTLGGGVSVAQLRKLKPAQVPALVWPVAEQVDGALLAAVAEKIAQGVPVLLVGNVPAAIGPGPDLRAQLGVKYTDDPATESGQQAGASIAAWPEARGLAQIPALSASTLPYQAAGIGVLVTRNGRLLLGRAGKTVVYAMDPKGLWDADDPAVLRVAVRALDEAMGHPIGWPEGVSGYAFRGADGATYAVVENLQPVPRTVTLRLPAPGAHAADLLSGAALPVKTVATGVEIILPLDGSDGTVVEMTAQ